MCDKIYTSESIRQMSGKDKILSKVIFTIIVMILLFIINCARDYNPFNDYSLARVQINSDLGDTSELYSSDTIQLTLIIPNLIEKITVHTDSNRYFTDTIFHNRYFDLSSEVHCDFTVCFFDTGWKSIRIETERKNGEVNTEELRLYIRQPLFQDSIVGILGKILQLQTRPVKDSNVVYNWRFGDLCRVESNISVKSAIIRAQSDSGIGELWVSDVHGEHCTPSVKFRYKFNDNTAPQIACLNSGINKTGDTIYTSESDFFFRVSVTDSGSANLDVKVNNKRFSKEEKPLYQENIRGIDSLDEAVLLSVSACDGSNNCTENSFCVLYDSAAASEKNIVIINIDASDSSDYEISRENYTVRGRIRNSLNTKIDAVMKIELNGKVLPLEHNITISQDDFYWAFDVVLASGINRLAVKVFDSSDNLLAEKISAKDFNSIYVDESMPHIVNLTINGNVLERNNSGIAALRNDTGNLLKIIAFDDESGIRSISVNNRDITNNIMDDDSGFVWFDHVTVSHNAVDTFRIHIIDSLDNFKDTVLFLVQNQIPEIDTNYSLSKVAFTGIEYRKKLKIIDKDQDEISFNLISSPDSGFTVNSDSTISWTPVKKDPEVKVQIKVSDKYESSIYAWNITVKGADEPSFRLLTDEIDFPAVIESTDTVKVKIIIDSATGKRPFLITGTVGSKHVDIFNGMAVWHPLLSDTGNMQMRILVRSSDGQDFSLFPSIRVIQPFDKNSVEISWTGDTTAAGYLDCTDDMITNDTLKVIIRDPYIKYRNVMVSSKCGNNKTLPVSTDSSGIVNIFINKKHGFNDSLIVYVNDTLGNSLSIKRMIDFKEPLQPVIVNPANNSKNYGSKITLNWTRCYNDTGTEYQVLLSSLNDASQFPASATTKDTSVTLECKTSGTYYARIICTIDNKIIQSAVVLYHVIVDNALYAGWQSADVPLSMVAGNDSLKLSITVENNNGPVTFEQLDSYSDQCSISKDGVLVFKPVKPGVANVNVKIQDSSGSITYLKLRGITVVSRNSPCSLSVNPAVDSVLILNDKVVILNFKIEDTDDYSGESYSVNVRLYSKSYNLAVDSTKKFEIKIDPDSVKEDVDTLTVIVSDAGGYSDTVHTLLHFKKDSLSLEYKFPFNGKIINGTEAVFEWAENADTVEYDFYISEDPDPLFYKTVKGIQKITVTGLQPGKEYYWKIIARAGTVTKAGEIWKIKTADSL